MLSPAPSSAGRQTVTPPPPQEVAFSGGWACIKGLQKNVQQDQNFSQNGKPAARTHKINKKSYQNYGQAWHAKRVLKNLNAVILKTTF